MCNCTPSYIHHGKSYIWTPGDMFKDAYGGTMSKSKEFVNNTNTYQQCTGQISSSLFIKCAI